MTRKVPPCIGSFVPYTAGHLARTSLMRYSFLKRSAPHPAFRASALRTLRASGSCNRGECWTRPAGHSMRSCGCFRRSCWRISRNRRSPSPEPSKYGIQVPNKQCARQEEERTTSQTRCSRRRGKLRQRQRTDHGRTTARHSPRRLQQTHGLESTFYLTMRDNRKQKISKLLFRYRSFCGD